MELLAYLVIYKESSGDLRKFCYVVIFPQDAYINSNEKQNTNQENNEGVHITRKDLSISVAL